MVVGEAENLLGVCPVVGPCGFEEDYGTVEGAIGVGAPREHFLSVGCGVLNLRELCRCLLGGIFRV